MYNVWTTEDKTYFKVYFYSISETPLLYRDLSSYLKHMLMERSRDIKAVSLVL